MSKGGHVLDASALLCLLFDAPGADRVERVLTEALADLRELDLEAVALDRAQAEATGLLRSATREARLSLGARTCLASLCLHVGAVTRSKRLP